MPRYHNQQTYIADGFILDCDDLIYKCTQGDSLNYHVFCNIWKDMKFHSIYAGRPKGAELGELSEEVIHVAKRYLVGKNHKIMESIAGLFLVYALINLQPYKRFAYLRLVAEDIEALRNIEANARHDKRIDVLYILGSVLIKGPVRYVASPREFGLEFSIRKYIAGFASIETVSAGKGVFFRNREELDLIREMNSLSKKYAEAKNMLMKSGQWNRSLNYSNDNLATELEASLKKLMSGCTEEAASDKDATKSSPVRDARAIKDRAMAGAVNPMRHLIAVTDKQSPPKKPVSPVKETRLKYPSNSYTHKQLVSCLRPKNLRKMSYLSDESDDDETTNTIDIEVDPAPSNVDLAAIDAEIETEEQEINIEIDSLPVFSRVEQNGKKIEIEVIDNFTANVKESTLKKNSNVKKEEQVKKRIEVLEDTLMGPPKKIPKRGKVSKDTGKSQPSTSKRTVELNKESLPNIESDENNETPLENEGIDAALDEPEQSSNVNVEKIKKNKNKQKDKKEPEQTNKVREEKVKINENKQKGKRTANSLQRCRTTRSSK